MDFGKLPKLMQGAEKRVEGGPHVSARPFSGTGAHKGRPYCSSDAR